jgi:hypothetical protein
VNARRRVRDPSASDVGFIETARTQFPSLETLKRLVAAWGTHFVSGSHGSMKVRMSSLSSAPPPLPPQRLVVLKSPE